MGRAKRPAGAWGPLEFKVRSRRQQPRCSRTAGLLTRLGRGRVSPTLSSREGFDLALARTEGGAGWDISTPLTSRFVPSLSLLLLTAVFFFFVCVCVCVCVCVVLSGVAAAVHSALSFAPFHPLFAPRAVLREACETVLY